MVPPLSPLVHAAIPQIISFQGRLTDANNNPRNESVNMVFTIYDQAVNGSQIWTENQTGVQVVNGVFSVSLGSWTVLPLVALNAPTRYLSVTVAGETLTPRQRLLASPYAMNAGTLDGNDAAAFVQVGNVNQNVAGIKTFTSNIVGSITGNAATVTNGVITTGSYANPVWITSLAGSKISGDISGNAGGLSNMNISQFSNNSGYIANTSAGDYQIASNQNSSAYNAASLELRELNFGSVQTGAISEAPRLSFHWGGRVASQIMMPTDGSIQIRNNPGTGYETLRAGNIYSNDTLVVGVPTGMIAFFAAACPSGWTEYTALRGRAVVGTPAGGTNAGTVGTPLSNLENRAHAHTGPSHSHTFSDTVSGTTSSEAPGTTSNGDHSHGSAGDHTHSAAGNHSHSQTGGNVRSDSAAQWDDIALAEQGFSTSQNGSHSHPGAGSHSHPSAGSHSHSVNSHAHTLADSTASGTTSASGTGNTGNASTSDLIAYIQLTACQKN